MLPFNPLNTKRVINFKFLLQLHQKYYITQYEELGFSYLTQMNDYYTDNSHYRTYTFLFKRLGECTILTWEWKGNEHKDELWKLLEFAILCSNRWLKTIVTARKKGAHFRVVSFDTFDLQSWSKVLGRYRFPPSPESMLEYQLHTVRNGHQLTPTLIRGEGGIIATHNVNDSLEVKQ